MTQPPYPTLNVHLLGRSEHVTLDGERSYMRHELTTLHFTPARPPPLECSFEEAYARLHELENLFAEPDGSFVWIGDPLNVAWQLDGMLYDHAGRVQWCELKGCCPLLNWHQLLRCFGWPTQPLVAHFIEEQFFVTVEELEILWR